MKRKADPPRLVTITVLTGRWNRRTGEIDTDPRDSGFKLQQPIIPN